MPSPRRRLSFFTNRRSRSATKKSVSEATVKAHVSAILQKLGADSRTQAVIMVNRIDSLQRDAFPLPEAE